MNELATWIRRWKLYNQCRKVNESIQYLMELLLLNETEYLSKMDLIRKKMCSTKALSLTVMKFHQKPRLIPKHTECKSFEYGSRNVVVCVIQSIDVWMNECLKINCL